MRKGSLFIALGMTLAVTTVPCYGFGKMVDGVVAEISEETDAAQKNGRNAGKMTIKEMVDIPGNYITNVIYNDNIFISADAPVEIPDVDAIPLKKTKPAVHTLEYYLNIINSLSDEPISLKDMIEDRYFMTGKFTINQLPYEFSFIYNPIDDDRFIWESFTINLAAEDLSVDEKGLYNMKTGEYLFKTRELSAKEYQAQAEAILEKCGFSEYSPTRITLGAFDKEDIVVYESPITFTDDLKGTAALLDCEHIIEQIPVTLLDENSLELYGSDTAENASELNLWLSESMELHFYHDNFISLCLKYPIEITGYSDEAQFLLPFHEIRGIFEEMLGLKITQLEGNGRVIGQEMDENGEIIEVISWNSLKDFPYESLEVDISRVKLGYMRVRDEDEKEGELEGMLIPVWDFFGTWTAKKAGEDGTIKEIKMKNPTSLLTLDARDGSVITRMVGY